jgi:hypothetical protein
VARPGRSRRLDLGSRRRPRAALHPRTGLGGLKVPLRTDVERDFHRPDRGRGKWVSRARGPEGGPVCCGAKTSLASVRRVAVSSADSEDGSDGSGGLKARRARTRPRYAERTGLYSSAGVAPAAQGLARERSGLGPAPCARCPGFLIRRAARSGMRGSKRRGTPGFLFQDNEPCDSLQVRSSARGDWSNFRSGAR